jgi:hypothetical protein
LTSCTRLYRNIVPAAMPTMITTQRGHQDEDRKSQLPSEADAYRDQPIKIVRHELAAELRSDRDAFQWHPQRRAHELRGRLTR